MKCYELKNCSPDQRDKCFVYDSFRHNLHDMENVACWILKKSCDEDSGGMWQQCCKCPYYHKINANTVTAQNGDHGTLLILCSGVLNTARAGLIDSITNRLSSMKRNRLIFDLTNVTNIYSSSIGEIIRLHLECRKIGAELVVSGARGYVQSIIENSKLNRVLNVVETIEDAYQLFSSSDNETKLIEKEDLIQETETKYVDLADAKPEEVKPEENRSSGADAHEEKGSLPLSSGKGEPFEENTDTEISETETADIDPSDIETSLTTASGTAAVDTEAPFLETRSIQKPFASRYSQKNDHLATLDEPSIRKAAPSDSPAGEKIGESVPENQESGEKKQIRCHQYFNGHNPSNMTCCSQCVHKQTRCQTPCWIIKKVSKGVVMEYVDENCYKCRFFSEYGDT